MNALQLITNALSGNRKAQARLYEQYAPYSLAVIRRYGIERHVEADLLQTIFIEVFRRLSQFDVRKGKFTTWLRQITVSRIIDFQRQNSRLYFAPIAEDLLSTAEQDQTSDHFAFDSDTLNRHIAALPDGYRSVFNLYAVEGYSHREIGKMLGISPAGSRSQYHRARTLLQKSLKKTLKIVTDEAI